MKIIDYVCLTAYSEAILQTLVNEKIKEGYDLHGQTVMTATASFGVGDWEPAGATPSSRDPDYRFMQAMVKREEK